jgi:hypothetical protein
VETAEEPKEVNLGAPRVIDWGNGEQPMRHVSARRPL